MKKYFVEFYNIYTNYNGQGKIVRAMGSDARQPLDGRLSFFNMKLTGFSRARKLKSLKRFDYMRIVLFEDYSDYPLTNYIPLDYSKNNLYLGER